MLNNELFFVGVGIQPEHCTIEIELEGGAGELILSPINGARSCVNGVEIKERTELRNGDRILWGSNHFFRVNCPKSSSELVLCYRQICLKKLGQLKIIRYFF